MGFLGSIGKAFTRGVTAVATGGISEVARAVAPQTARTLEAAFAPTTLPALTKALSYAAVPATGGTSMAFDFRNLFGTVGGVLQGVSAVPALQTVGQFTSAFAPYVPAPSVQPVAQQAQIISAGRAPALTKEVFDAGMKVLNRVGLPVPAVAGRFISTLKRVLGSLMALARRTPAGTIISLLVGLGLTAYEANLLTAWYSVKRKRRRMNPANSKALRRAARRIQSFHRLCTHTDVLKMRRRKTVGRCATCRSSPCRC